MSISVLVLTKNEEKDLPDCLKSVSWSDDIHVFDSLSSDRTLEIARVYGAHITQRPFDNWAKHQNWGLQNIAFKYPWVFYIDADERMTPELAEQVKVAVASAGENVAFRVHRRDFFQGRWLKHVQVSSFYLRLFRPQFMRYERLVNPISLPDGPVGQVAGYLDHFPFSKGLEHWLDRHNAYSTLEAKQIADDRLLSGKLSISKAFLASDFHEKRYHQKEFFFRLPLRPVLKFVLLYIIKGGFLDGRPGFNYALLQSIYEYFIVLKTPKASR